MGTEAALKSALVIIDVQVGLVRLVPPQIEDRVLSSIAVLLRKSRSFGIPVLFVQHDGPKGHPLEADTPAWGIHPSILPMKEERVIRKKASDSFFETRLAEELQTNEISRLIVVGGMTEYCVDTTCRRAVTLGYDVTLVADAHLTRDTPVLKAAQIIAHHNFLLDGFAAGMHSIQVIPAGEISL
ncbi:MAG TPA: cysteine hydrolase family protein [Terriglobales bacterium]|nr:cysteine hydrolase family protein [Terriglobales bacterium]